MHLVKILVIQTANLAILAFLSELALESRWKVCLLGLAAILVTSGLAMRYKDSAVALTVGALPIAWIVGLALVVSGGLLGLRAG